MNRYLAILVTLSGMQVAWSGHLDHRLGLRWTEQVSPRQVRLLFGASFVPSIGREPQTYRVVSSTDPDFKHGIRAQSVRATIQDDGPFPSGWKGRRFKKALVLVTLPMPMRRGHRYWVQAMGVRHQPVTGGRAAHWIMPQGSKAPERAVKNRLGIRSIEVVGPRVLKITLGAGVYTAPAKRAAEVKPRIVYQVNFEKGIPKTWQAYKELTTGLSPGNQRAVLAAHLIKWNGSIMVQDYQHKGAFTVNASTGTLSFDYLARDASGIQVRLTSGGPAFVYTIGKPVLGKWTRAVCPVKLFHDEKDRRRKAVGPLRVRCLQFVAFKADKTPFLAVDNITVDSAPALLAGDIPPHDPARYILRSTDDPDYRDGRPAVRMGRRSRIDCYYTDGWPYGTFKKHEVFLVFDRAFKEGKTYTIDLNEGAAPITCGHSRGKILFSSQASINPIIKVNQLGYLPDAPAKYAYVGCWMGSLGTLDLAFLENLQFEVRNAKTHEVAYKERPKLRLRHVFNLAPDGTLEPRNAKGRETVYKQDLSYEDIYELDLTPLKEPGDYYVAIPGMGRSFDFRISRDVYQDAFRVIMNGIFHQRCGIEITMPYSKHYRPACHRNMTELTEWTRSRQNRDWKQLPKHVVSDRKYDLYGGHHDASDFNPRAHLDVVEYLFFAYELAPTHFYDGQNNIPEKNNGIPDILDEARWGLDLWVRLQDQDGGVRNGTESDGDPDMITTAEIDYKRDFAFAKDARGSLRFAAAAAQAALIWRKLGKKDDAAELLRRSEMAYNWAMNNMGTGFPDDLVLAAIQLYRATGEKNYLNDFHRHSVFRANPKAEHEVWQKYDQQDASFYYAFCKRKVDSEMKARILDAFRRRIAFWTHWAKTCGYRYMRNPYAPNTWGTGAYPIHIDTAIQAYALLKQKEILKWIILTCDFSLGCHPMNMVFITRLGKRYISGPLHSYSRYSPEGPIAGIQCEGPSPKVGGAPAGMSMTSWIAAGLFPNGPWPQLHTYCDVEMSPGMNEGIVRNMAKTAVAYSFLLPDYEK